MRQVQSPSKLAFERINYFFGQVLGLNDFRDAQAYFLEKLRLHHRCLHGWGAVCGLDVSALPSPEDPCAPATPSDHVGLRRRAADLRQQAGSIADSAGKLPAGQAQDELRKVVRTLEQQARETEALCGNDAPGEDAPGKRTRLGVSPGLAIDTLGRELVVDLPLEVEVWRALSPEDRRTVEAGGTHTLWVSLCFAETPTRAVRPLQVDRCAPQGDQFARIREATCVRVSLARPDDDQRCEPCCTPASVECVLLASIEGYSLGGGLGGQVAIDEGVRRMLSLHDPVTITGLSWVHGGHYAFDRFQRLVGRADGYAQGKNGPGLALSFSREIDPATVAAPGVFEVLRYGGGGAPSGDLQWIPFKMEDPRCERVKRVVFRQATDERWSPGDRLHVKLRCDFVLDACCLPVDGNHVGGKVPLLPDGIGPDDDDDEGRGKRHRHEHEHEHEPASCAGSPFRPGAWRSGNGTPGGTFESWIYVAARRPSAEAR
jgi:hypothetical protein